MALPLLIQFRQDTLQFQIDNLVIEGLSTVEVEEFLDLILATLNADVAKNEGLQRLTQSVINHFNEQKMMTTRLGELFSTFTSKLGTTEEEMITKLPPMLEPFLTVPETELNDQLNQQQHRNVCLFIYFVLEGRQPLLPRTDWQLIINYLVRIVNNTTVNRSTVLWAVLGLEKASKLGLDYSKFNECLLEMKQEYADFFDNCTQDQLYKADFDLLKYQIGFLCANYITMTGEPWYPPSPPPPNAAAICPAICPPCTSLPGGTEVPEPARVHYYYPTARNDDWNLPTVRSMLAVSSGVYYYEAVLVTSGNVLLVGWATREACFSEAKGVGADRYGVALGTSGLYHGGFNPIANIPAFQAGTIIGCLIDFTKSTFTFTVNGIELSHKPIMNQHFSAQPYFATVTLGPHEQIYLNFGQIPFKYPPVDRHFTNFHQKSKKNIDLYRLSVPTLVGKADYYFKDGFAWDNPILPMFADTKQDSLDRLVIELEVDPDLGAEFSAQLAALLEGEEDFGVHRLITSIITELGHRTADDESLQGILDTILPELEVLCSLRTPTVAKLLELLYPYTQSRKLDDQPQYPGICLALLAVIPHLNRTQRILLLTEELVYFLENVLVQGGQRQLYQLYAALCIQQFAGEIENRSKFTNKTRRMLNQLKLYARSMHKVTARILAKSPFDRMQLQLGLVSSSCLDMLTEYSGSERQKIIDDIVAKGLEGLPHGIQTVRNCSTQTYLSAESNFTVNTGVSYCEAVILTAGTSLEVGWYHSGDHQTRVSFDGFKSKLIQNRTEIEQQMSSIAASRWKPGNVLGFRLDFNQKKMGFYLNGVEIRFIEPIVPVEVGKEYQMIAFIGKQQQVYFNFGQEKFLFEPKDS